MKHDSQPMKQAEFAAFLEDHVHEVAVPEEGERHHWENLLKSRFATPVELIDLSRGLEVTVGARVKNKQRLESGETQMVFEVEHRDASGNELTIPGLFLISVPAFYRGEPLRIPARLRYRLQGGEIVWFYQLFRPDEGVDDRLRNDVITVQKRTGLPTYDGAPEGPSPR